MENLFVVTSQTAFEISYLYEIALDVEINSANFEALSTKYNINQFFTNLPYDVLERRQELCRKRLSHGYFLFAYLELGQRYKIPNWFIIKTTLDNAILEHREEFMKEFRERWTIGHQCDKKGCGEAMIIDGGLKPHRPICYAKLSGVRQFPMAGVSTVTGCTR